MPRKEVNHGLHQKALFGRSPKSFGASLPQKVTNLSYQINIYSGWPGCPILIQAKCWHEAKYSVVLFWRNEKPPHWDGRSDRVGWPVHTSVPQFGWWHVCTTSVVPSTIVKQDALIFCTLCVCHAILALPSRGESLGWQVHAWQLNPVLDH